MLAIALGTIRAPSVGFGQVERFSDFGYSSILIIRVNITWHSSVVASLSIYECFCMVFV